MNANRKPWRTTRILVTGLAVLAIGSCWLAPTPQQASAEGGGGAGSDHSLATSLTTTTPIKHLVILFQENNTFDHYFATYPRALNLPGETPFHARPNTPTVNNLASVGLLAPTNPNSAQPVRLSPGQSWTCSMNHSYTPLQKAVDGGKMDKFVENTESLSTKARQYCPKGIVMSYVDGNTVTGLWNYAQNYAMSDNSFSTTFGPSTPGALNLIAGDTAGAVCGDSTVYQAPAACSPTTPPATTASLASSGTVVGDPDQYYDDASKGGYGSPSTAAVTVPNIGERLRAAGITWGWFNGGFDNPNASHNLSAFDRFTGVDPSTDTATLTTDYSAHHEPFQYFASTSNPHHAKPAGMSEIGSDGPANHQYDLTDFWTAADAGNLPAVSFLKAPKNQDGHPGNSDPLDEQEFLVSTINHLQSLPSWRSTAVIISWDDSEGWYDHVAPPVVNHSTTSLDTPYCGPGTDGAPARCGFGMRLPYLVISPYARPNYVDHTLTDQTSTLRFIEDNWLDGKRLSAESADNRAGSIAGMFDFSAPKDSRRLILDPLTGTPLPTEDAVVVNFTSAKPGQGWVIFGPTCSALVETATRDRGAGTTSHSVLVMGNDLPGTVSENGLLPGTTYYYATVSIGPSGTQTDDKGGRCYTMRVAGP